MKILAHLENMARNEILDIIDTAKYAEIRDKDPHPNFKAYVIGQEGAAQGRFVGIGKVAAQWFKSAIEKITNLLQIGTKVFHGHEQTNIHANREPIGEVVGKAIRNIGNKISSIAIMYLYPQYKDLPLDIASIEADVLIPKNLKAGMKVVDADVKNITGIALGSSAIGQPAFPGARKLGELQAFIASYRGGREKMTTIDEIKEFITENKDTKPSDLFSIGQISEDPIVKAFMKDEKSGEYYARKRNQEEFEKEKIKIQNENTDLKKKFDEQVKVNLKIQAKDKVEAIIKERKLDERQANFIRKDKDKFDPTEEKMLAVDLNKFIDTKLDDYEKTLEALGIKKTETQKEGGVPKGKEDQLDQKDLSNPANNDFIPDF